MAKRGRYTDPGIVGEIEDRALKGKTPLQIYRELEQDEKYLRRLPSLRTIQSIVKEVSVHDDSGPWSVGKADADAIPLILEVLGAVLGESQGRITSFTLDEAGWIKRIWRSAPDLGPWAVYHLAKTYQLAEERKENTRDLDIFLAVAPWRPDQKIGFHRRDLYAISFKRGWIARPTGIARAIWETCVFKFMEDEYRLMRRADAQGEVPPVGAAEELKSLPTKWYFRVTELIADSERDGGFRGIVPLPRGLIADLKLWEEGEGKDYFVAYRTPEEHVAYLNQQRQDGVKITLQRGERGEFSFFIPPETRGQPTLEGKTDGEA